MFMRIITLLVTAVLLTGCSTVKKYWPRAHDPVLVSSWVDVKMAVDRVDCSQKDTGWSLAKDPAQRLYLLADFRADPQRDNLKGLRDHIDRMTQGGSKTFCELGKRTADARLSAAKTAWEGR